VNDELERMQKETVLVYFKVPSRHFPELAEERNGNPKRIFLRTKNRTLDFAKTKQEANRYSDTFGAQMEDKYVYWCVVQMRSLRVLIPLLSFIEAINQFLYCLMLW
jgi:hypothetical protein